MVGRLMLLKLLHCKRKQRRDNQVFIPNQSETSKKIHVKKEATDELTCRVCLKNGDIPIFGGNGYADISEEFCSFADIQISRNDAFAKYICRACHSLLQGAIIFRKTAQVSDKTLRPTSFLNVNDNIENDDFLNSEPEDIFKSAQDLLYNCKLCNLSFITFDEYTEHRLSREHENKRFTCHICKKSYKPLYFKKHMALHEQGSLYICDICGKQFIVRAQFLRHRAIHNFDFPFKCSLCPYRGRFRESLKGHMFTHTGEKPYQCSECPFRCVSKSNLNKHAVIHKKDHDFKCESCGRGFYTKKALESHLKVDHAGIKEHVCNICGKEFGYRKQMMKHQLKVHKRQKMRSGRMPLYLQLEAQESQASQIGDTNKSTDTMVTA